MHLLFNHKNRCLILPILSLLCFVFWWINIHQQHIQLQSKGPCILLYSCFYLVDLRIYWFYYVHYIRTWQKMVRLINDHLQMIRLSQSNHQHIKYRKSVASCKNFIFFFFCVLIVNFLLQKSHQHTFPQIFVNPGIPIIMHSFRKRSSSLT